MFFEMTRDENRFKAQRPDCVGSDISVAETDDKRTPVYIYISEDLLYKSGDSAHRIDEGLALAAQYRRDFSCKVSPDGFSQCGLTVLLCN